MAKKKTGEIGPVSISVDATGVQTATQLSAQLPTNKEELEEVFARRFVKTFNERSTWPGVKIASFTQQGTEDLDFKIACSRAQYLELAELTPLSAEFGREAKQTGKLDVLEFATWIYDSVVKAKSDKYGPTTAGATFLLLYSTHPQFLASEALIDCLRSVCFWRGHHFAGIFVLRTNGMDGDMAINIVDKVSPALFPAPSRPEAFKGRGYMNLDILKQVRA